MYLSESFNMQDTDYFSTMNSNYSVYFYNKYYIGISSFPPLYPILINSCHSGTSAWSNTLILVLQSRTKLIYTAK